MAELEYLLGDTFKAQLWLPYARKMLVRLKSFMDLTNIQTANRFYDYTQSRVSIYIESNLGFDTIRIIAAKGKLECVSWTKVGEFGVKGTGSGKFNERVWFDLDDNYFYTSDSAINTDHKVQIFDRTSPYALVKHISYPAGGGNVPRGITVDANFFYVVITSDLDIYDNTSPFGLVTSIDLDPDLSNQSTTGDVVVDDSFIYVTINRHDVQVFDITSPYSLDRTLTGFSRPVGLALNTFDATDNNLYVCDKDNFRVRIVDKTTGVQQGVFGSEGDGNGQFRVMQAIAVDKDQIYVTDVVRDDLQIFNIKSPYGFKGIVKKIGSSFDGLWFDIQSRTDFIYLSTKQLDVSYKKIMWAIPCPPF